ncbi:MAG TPA: hypothetical protein VFV63_14165 [Ilumatobacteraceae bacterium]|nr:hypothetical protein [Ilumatobacteraceae bacterium]
MIATDAVTSNMTTGDRWTANRRLGASPGSLAFLAGHLGAGLGWHGSIAHSSATSGELYQLVESCS